MPSPTPSSSESCSVPAGGAGPAADDDDADASQGYMGLLLAVVVEGLHGLTSTGEGVKACTVSQAPVKG